MASNKIRILTAVIVGGLFLSSGLFLKKQARDLYTQKPSDLEKLIPAEVKNDAFYEAIYNLARTAPIKNILEIGSSSGEGSTEAFAIGIKENPHRPTLFCVEFSKPRFSVLKEHYSLHPLVKCYNVSSVPMEVFPKEEEVTLFYQTTPTALNKFPLNEVIRWLKQDIDYLKTSDIPQRGIELIKSENGIENFDMVLIDGSEFTGMAEFELIYGAKYILLDDIHAFKNYNNYKKLLSDPNYKLLEENVSLRHGYAIFQKE